MSILLTAPIGGATVRMYRTGGLGDCFLLAFGRADGVASYVLIDCGVFLGTPNSKERMQEVAEDIKQATGGKLDVIVATHEHWDHLSGFEYAEDIFRTITVGEVWVAWTEDEQNPLARQLQTQRKKKLHALTAAVTRLTAADENRGKELQNILDFNGMAAKGEAKQMDLVRSFSETVRYCRPGQAPLQVPEVAGLKVFVLGPPEDSKLIKQSRPRKGDIYTVASNSAELSLEMESSFYAAVEGLETAATEMPFNASFGARIAEAVASTEYNAFFDKYYGADSDKAGMWRRIDTDWLLAAEQLALKLDSNTNNTSLALAFELGNGDVLLFPGDAQVGNWRSWHQVSWDKLAPPIKGPELLNRTVLYKVGHHASENATLSSLGLELMESEKLVALIPVDAEQARKKSWNMPYLPLYERLLLKTKGRILRSDQELPTKPADVPGHLWQDFEKSTSQDESGRALWVQIEVNT
ncbi:MBL fold metallo-hydrolase [Hymenobacter psychrophilus]|uniref:Metallo-beta-lactamase superfamily protein n=1 Tax=Hymenobacter psychrophilus TaxID=651662 RepID=A0A1H3N365_9BACT|nr:MBL fold metallo-hydrolase [Hymenobacter psychrophilus]SDY83322.1 Metallo-beta-lactamase superfamily protein [Hymenobacter psychrophilus]